MTQKNIRTGLHSLLMSTFIIVGLTGILLLFHINVTGVRHLHEWMSIGFLILCVLHLYLNWKAVRAHLKNGPILLSVLGICLLLLLRCSRPATKTKKAPTADQAQAITGI